MNNKEFNQMLKKNGALYRRRGTCKNCRGKCCNFVVIGRKDKTTEGCFRYFKAHGALEVKDKWLGYHYLLFPSQCSLNDSCGNCLIFNKKSMPNPCFQFPHPQDSIYRYLLQTGNPCSFFFVDARTGKPWSMKRKVFFKKLEVKKNGEVK